MPGIRMTEGHRSSSSHTGISEQVMCRRTGCLSVDREIEIVKQSGLRVHVERARGGKLVNIKDVVRSGGCLEPPLASSLTIRARSSLSTAPASRGERYGLVAPGHARPR